MLRGAPFAALSNSRIRTMFELLEVKKAAKFLDLGSGDGRIVLFASKVGLEAYGYEINPLLVIFSRIKIIKNKSKGIIKLTDYWSKSLETYDYIAVWGVPMMMKRLEKKLLNELQPGAKVVSNHYPFPNWKTHKIKNDVYLYIKSK